MRRLFAACVFACALLIGSGAAAQSKPGIFDADRDIGDVSGKGSLAYDAKAGTYTVTSSGAPSRSVPACSTLAPTTMVTGGCRIL